MAKLGRTELLILVPMVCAVLMNGIDGSIINVALPTVANYFGTNLSQAAWVTILYFMMMAGLLLPFGRVADAGHIRRVFLTGFAVFTVSSLLCGISEDFTMLLVCRAAQGLGAAMTASTAPMICVKFMPVRALGLCLGIMTLSSALGYSIGPFLGGILTEYASWHWIFLINIPIGLFAIAFGFRVIPKEEAKKDRHLDLLGTALLFVTVVCGVFALERFTYPGSEALCASACAAMFIALVLFVLVERTNRMPLLKPSMFRNWRFVSVSLSLLLMNMVYMGILYIIPFYLESVAGLTSSQSGYVLLIPSVITLILCIPIGRLCDAGWRRAFAIASSAFNLGYSVTFMLTSPETGMLLVFLTVILMGLMWGTCGSSSSSRIVDNAPADEKGMGSSFMSFMTYAGSTIGTALFASLMTIGADASGTSIDQLSQAAFMDGIWFSGMWAVALSALALVCAFIVNENHRPGVDG